MGRGTGGQNFLFWSFERWQEKFVPGGWIELSYTPKSSNINCEICQVLICSETRFKSQLFHHGKKRKHSVTILVSVWQQSAKSREQDQQPLSVIFQDRGEQHVCVGARKYVLIKDIVKPGR